LARATTVDEAAAVGELARNHSDSAAGGEGMLRVVSVTPEAATTRIEKDYAPAGSYALVSVYEHALAKEIALSSDPVQKIELSYTLSASLEGRHETAAAVKIVDGVYRDNPRILGVVRATTDFYARIHEPPRAIGTLLESAKVATPDLSRSFTLEAANRANEAGDTSQARALAQALLQQTPYDAAVLGVIANSYARANDDAGLKAFYLAELASVKTAALTPNERKSDTALLRRGLIPALTRTKDYAGAVDQYIALVSAYPEDSSTAQEAALYALRYSRQDQLLTFLRTTVRQSPQDSRFAILLAQAETTFDDLPAAVAAYSQAIAIRKDRADVYEARADLEVRLGIADPRQMDAAAADFSRLYVLSYKDPAWMVRLAELRARQQRPADAVKALVAAYITGQTASPINEFRVADQLAQWNMLVEARTFADEGVRLAGASVLTDADGGGTSTYARVMTRLGKPDEALKTLAAAYTEAARDVPFPPTLVAQYTKAGVSASDIARDAKSYNENRRQTARQQLEQAVTAMGQTVEAFYTPEQKLAYAHTLDTLHTTNAPLALSAATSAGLADREAAWRKELLLSGAFNPSTPPDDSAYVQLERRRLAFGELAQTLEAFAPRVAPGLRNNILHQAAEAYRDAGDETDELRITRPLVFAQDTGLRDRFLDLLLRHDRAALTALASSNDDTLADAAANYAVAHATEAQALSAINQRARRLPAVWGPATASLVATNFASSNATSPASRLPFFMQSLEYEQTIAERLAKPADTSRQLTGDLWFYNASRFGLFLATVPRSATLPDAEDFLPAELERAPTAPAAYLHLARNYADEGRDAESTTEYLHALEIAPNNPAVHDELAVVLYRAGHRDEALAQWRAGLKLMSRRQTGEEFFATFKSMAYHLGQRSLTATFRPELEAVLKPYFARNGNYRSNELLEAIDKASATPAEGTSFVLAAVNFAPDPNLLLDDLRNATWITPEVRETILLRQIQLARNRPSAAQDLAQTVRGYQMTLLQLYIDRNQLAEAQQLLDAIAVDPKANVAMERIVLAARTGHLQTLLSTWQQRADAVPDDTAIEDAIAQLQRRGPSYTPDPAVILTLEEFVFERKQLSHTLAATDYLALAQSRIDTSDVPGAVDLLHRLALQPGSRAQSSGSYGETLQVGYRFDMQADPYVNTDNAASLLEAAHQYGAAASFLGTLVQAVPWNASYRLRLAEAELKSDHAADAARLLTAVARDASAPYETRVKAAQDLGSMSSAPAQDLGSGELSLLASNANRTPAAARQRYFAVAREDVALSASIAKPQRIALLREAVAISPNGLTANKVRLELLLNQTAIDSSSATLAIVHSLSDAQPSAGDDAAESSTDQAEDSADGPFRADGPEPTAFAFPLAQTLDRATQIRLAVLLASAYQRDHDPAQSLFYDRLAVSIDAQNAKPDPVVVKRLSDYEAILALGRKNALRRPLIHKALDQTNQVRPRLTLADQARAEAP
jgi:hypothetical protein